MFTIGRDREKEHAALYVKAQGQRDMINVVIDRVHDVMEGISRPEEIIDDLADIFTRGGSGVWEKTGSWITKLTADHLTVSRIWKTMAAHRSAAVRFRVATFLDNIPSEVRAELFPVLLHDRSAKVRQKVAGDCHIGCTKGELTMLKALRDSESSPEVIESLDFALEAIKNLA